MTHINAELNTGELYIVYQAEDGTMHYQHYLDTVENAGFIHPETGEEYRAIGWTAEKPSE